MPACTAASARAGTSFPAVPRREGGIYKSVDGGETWTKLSSGLPSTLIGKIDIGIARSQPSTVYAMVEAPGNEGGLYKSSDAGASWKLVNGAANLRTRPFYFHYVDVNPKDANEVWVELADTVCARATAASTFSAVPTPHADNHGIWFNPDNPSYAIQANDGGANVTTDGGRTWSSILNQPTAELYMVAVDQQHPYLLYAPQQDNSTVVVPSVPTGAFGFDHPAQAFTQASGCETGGIWPTPDGRIVWGACKGEVERLNVQTGQAQGRWIYPQDRYGHHPDEIKFRFPRQTVIMVSPHDPKTVYQASHVLHRSTDDGRDVAGDQPGPHRAREGVSGRARTADHARRHRRGGLFDDLLDGRVADRARRDLGRRQRRSGARHARQRQDVEERHAAGSGAGRSRAEHRRLADPARVGLHRRLSLICASTI